jgi:hypothetical protein
MKEDRALIEQQTQNEILIDKIFQEQGVDGLLIWLLNNSELDIDWNEARHALRLLSLNNSADWPSDVVKLSIEAVSEVVRQRTRNWDLESLIHKLDEAGRSAVVTRIRGYLTGDNLAWAVHAARCLRTVGYRYDEAFEELSSLASRLSDEDVEKSIVINVAAYLGVLPSDSLKDAIHGLIYSSPGYSSSLAHLIASHGDIDDFSYLETHFENPTRDVLMAMLTMCLRVPDVRERTQSYFLSVEASNRWGLDHFAVRVFDSAELIEQYIDMIFAAWSHQGEGLPQITLIKSCLRESHLESLANSTKFLRPERLALLEKLVIEPSGNSGLMDSHSTFRKSSAISLSSRLGIAALRTWLPKAMQGEVNRGLIQRMAQDCCFFDVQDFILSLKEALTIEGDRTSSRSDQSSESEVGSPPFDNPMWLVSDEAGLGGGETTLRLLLESDGRHGMDQALMTYVEGLAFAAVNVGSTQLLTEAMLEESQPLWRRAAAAHAIRTAHLYTPTPKTNWKAAEIFVTDLSQDRFARHELLIGLAEHDSEAAARALSLLPQNEIQVSQVLLAKIIARFEVDEAIAGLQHYLTPVNYPHKPSFEEAYAAVCVAMMYEKGDISGEVAAAYMQQGLQHELIQFCISCDKIRIEDESLFDTVWSCTLKNNTSWMSSPSLWRAAGRYRPQRLLFLDALNYIQTTSDSSIKGFLDALIEQREMVRGNDQLIWPFLLELMREGKRAVAWYSSFAASIICPNCSKEFIRSNLADDVDLRAATECALWLEDEIWHQALENTNAARWRKVRDYALELNEEREKLRLADVYLGKVITATDRLQDWRYAQALLQLPSERVLQRLQEWDVDTIQDGYLSNWLQKEIGKALKRREKLFEKFRLPGEDAFPRWF